MVILNKECTRGLPLHRLAGHHRQRRRRHQQPLHLPVAQALLRRAALPHALFGQSYFGNGTQVAQCSIGICQLHADDLHVQHGIQIRAGSVGG